jgi:hypothetical protein
MRKTLVALFCLPLVVFAQSPYPLDYFRSPLEVPLILSGTFAELRTNHFHSGLDIRTQQREGLKVIAVADGYVSRIKISHFGYGKALYITHPNGYTSVYAHLQKFAPEIEEYVRKKQYEKESYEIELFPTVEELPISIADLVAYSGNTGGSQGPHLHFEIRDKQARPINPMQIGIEIKDTKRPFIMSAFAYPIGEDAHVNYEVERTKLRITPVENGDYFAENVEAHGKIGIGIVAYDKLDFTNYKVGVAKIQSIYNGNRVFVADFKRFSFGETKHINRHIDYEYFKTDKSRIQKLFVEENNPLSIYQMKDGDGYITVLDSTSNVYKVRITDYKGNETWLHIPISGKAVDSLKPRDTNWTETYLFAGQSTELKEGNISVSFPANTFYEDTFIDFKVSNDTLTLHKPIIPTQKTFSINFDVSHYSGDDKNKLYIASVSPYRNKLYYTSTRREGNILTARTKNLGTYTLAIDTEKPVIKPYNFQDGKWLSKYRYLKLKISDKHSGIKNYRATVNGKWILMEYDYKKGTLVHDFNDIAITDTKNILKIIVTDNVGNSSTFETTFYRK